MVLRSGIMGAAGAGRAGDGTGTPGRWDPRDPPAPQGPWDTGAVTRRTPFGGSETCSRTPWTGVTGANWTCSCWCSRGGCPKNPLSAALKTHSALPQKLSAPPRKLVGAPESQWLPPWWGVPMAGGQQLPPSPLGRTY